MLLMAQVIWQHLTGAMGLTVQCSSSPLPVGKQRATDSDENSARFQPGLDPETAADERRESDTTSLDDPMAEERRLFRSRRERVLGGVAGGLAEYLTLDPVVVRIVLVVLFFMSEGAVILGYLVAWVLIPERTKGESGSDSHPDRPSPADGGSQPSEGTDEDRSHEFREKARVAAEEMAETGARAAHTGASKIRDRDERENGDSGSLLIGIALIAIGGFIFLRRLPISFGFQFWRWDYGIPAIMIVIGLFVLLSGRRDQ